MAHFEKRRSARRMTTVGAKIIPADRSLKARTCKVVDLSRTGARLAAENPLSVPDEFTLVLDGAPSGYRSKVAWRSRSQVGVRFVTEAEDRPAPSFGKRMSVDTERSADKSLL